MRAILTALAATSLMIACASASEEPEPVVDTHLHGLANDAGATDAGATDAGKTTSSASSSSSSGSAISKDAGTGTNFPAESDPEGKVPTTQDTSSCNAGHGGSGQSSIVCAGLVVFALVNARRRRSA